MPKTTKKQFEIFKEEARKWIDYFGLKAWQVIFDHMSLDGTRARCVWGNIPDRIVRLQLSTHFNDKPDDREIRKVAFHEVCELLLARLQYLGMDRTTSQFEMVEAAHEVIRTLENVLWEKCG